jgi:hypothetical protein
MWAAMLLPMPLYLCNPRLAVGPVAGQPAVESAFPQLSRCAELARAGHGSSLRSRAHLPQARIMRISHVLAAYPRPVPLWPTCVDWVA